MIEDPRAQKKGICGVTTFDIAGREWICIKKIHAKVYIRKTGDHRHPAGEPIFNTNPIVDSHYFVTRWPGRHKETT